MAANYGAAFDYLEARDCGADEVRGAGGRALRAGRPANMAPTGWGRAKRRRKCAQANPCAKCTAPLKRCLTCEEGGE